MLLGKEPAVVETYVGGNSEIRTSGNTNTRTGYYWRKRMVNGNCKAAGVAGYDGRFRFYRLGKIYLNAAEAAIESGHLTEGLEWINEIRHRAGFDPSVDLSTNDKNEARLLVRHERQIELACEEDSIGRHDRTDVAKCRMVIIKQNVYEKQNNHTFVHRMPVHRQ